MKYKAIQEFPKSTYTKEVNIGEMFSNEYVYGITVFIPFSDTRFFEPVKTRKFVVEVDDVDQTHFDWVNSGQNWTVTEITETKYLEALKANREVSSLVIEVLSKEDNIDRVGHLFHTSLNEHGRNNKLSIVKDMKYFLVERFPQIDGLKNAKDIVESFWNL